jgi:hypothetical protein
VGVSLMVAYGGSRLFDLDLRGLDIWRYGNPSRSRGDDFDARRRWVGDGGKDMV